MIKILHGADFHLDSPFDSLPEEKAAERRREQRMLLDSLAELAEKEQVDAVLLAGDLFDGDKYYYETSEALLSAMSRIDCPVFISPGNHDYYSPISPYALIDFPDNVHIFTSPEPEVIELRGKGAFIHGAAFTSSAGGPALSDLKGLKESKDINIMCLHGQLGSSDKYTAITEKDISASGLDYLALGHIHAYSGIKRAGKTSYAYCGCPEGRGFDELGDKGVIIAEIGKGFVKGKLVPLGKRKYCIMQVDLSQSDDACKTVIEAVPSDAKSDIYRIVLTGEYSGTLDMGRMCDEIAPHFYYVTMQDSTRLRRDIWAEAEEDTLKGLFLRKMRAKFDEADEDSQETIVLAVRYALAAMERGEQWRT